MGTTKLTGGGVPALLHRRGELKVNFALRDKGEAAVDVVRPEWGGGAFFYFTHAHSEALLADNELYEQIRDGQELSSKFVIVSSCYEPLLLDAMSEQLQGSGREVFLCNRAGQINERIEVECNADGRAFRCDVPTRPSLRRTAPPTAAASSEPPPTTYDEASIEHSMRSFGYSDADLDGFFAGTIPMHVPFEAWQGCQLDAELVDFLALPESGQAMEMLRWSEVWTLVQRGNGSWIKINKEPHKRLELRCNLCDQRATLQHLSTNGCVAARTNSKAVMSPLLKVLVGQYVKQHSVVDTRGGEVNRRQPSPPNSG